MSMAIRALKAQGAETCAVLGFNSAEDVYYADAFAAICDSVILATADGSRGVRGFVTDAMAGLAYDYFYTCGPMVMMKAVCALCPTDGQASLEERMGCGFGICYGCTVATQDGPRRVCADGPVFTKTQLGW